MSASPTSPESLVSERDLCERLRHGDAAALDILLARHYSVSTFLTKALILRQRDSATILGEVWSDFVRDILDDRLTADVRPSVLSRLIAVLADRDLLDVVEPPPPIERFLGLDDDRWAGWWEGDPTALSADTVTPAAVLDALRTVPIEGRALLVLRDAAELAPEDVQDIVRLPAAQQNALLDQARETYVSALEQEQTRHERGDRQL